VLELRDHAAKMGGGRLIPLHPDLQQALSALRQSSPGAGPVVCSERGGPMKPLSIIIWFKRAYEALGLDGCSSHSGRRTFITRAARLVHKAGGSLRAVTAMIPVSLGLASILYTFYPPNAIRTRSAAFLAPSFRISRAR
jgi:integrase/recombinase XerD